MKKHQRLRQKRFNEHIARTGLVKRTRFYIGVDPSSKTSYTTTTILYIGRQTGKTRPFYVQNVDFDELSFLQPGGQHEQAHERKTPDGSRPVSEAPGA